MSNILGTLYASFSKWLVNRCEEGTARTDAAKGSSGYSWYSPGIEQITVLDAEDIEKLFDREDCQKDFKKWLESDGCLADSAVIRFQSTMIAADERAFRIRHATVPRAYAHGLMNSSVWSEEQLKELFIQYVINMRSCAQLDKNTRKID